MAPSKHAFVSSMVNRRTLLSTLPLVAYAPALLATAQAQEAANGLASWNDGPAKQAILDFVRATTDQASSKFVPASERIAVFDQDGTLWVEHPMYTFMTYCFERVPIVVKAKPALKEVEPFKTVLSGNRGEIAKLTTPDLEKILAAALTGMTLEEFKAEATKWLETARHPRWDRPYTELVYQPMLEVLRFLRANDYRTYMVTGGGQDFARMGSEKVYGIPPEQVVGTASATKYEYNKDGRPTLFKEPKLTLFDDFGGKAEGIHLMIGRRPYAAFGKLDRRPADARIHWRRRWHSADDAGAARRCATRICLWPGPRTSRHQGRHFHTGAIRRGQEGRLDRDQHEEGLEAHLLIRIGAA
jgi:phosphoglycolate phosphatase-like HAD superfamily hydrolase